MRKTLKERVFFIEKRDGGCEGMSSIKADIDFEERDCISEVRELDLFLG